MESEHLTVSPQAGRWPFPGPSFGRNPELEKSQACSIGSLPSPPNAATPGKEGHRFPRAAPTLSLPPPALQLVRSLLSCAQATESLVLLGPLSGSPSSASATEIRISAQSRNNFHLELMLNWGKKRKKKASDPKESDSAEKSLPKAQLHRN